MVDVLEWLKKNRIKIIKGVITIVVVYFLFCSILQLLHELSRNIFQTLTILYIILIVLCNLLSEFSPYVLHNYLLSVFPFLSHYNGRGIIYILAGLLYLSPELNSVMNLAGIAVIVIGGLCLWVNWLLAKNIQVDYQDFVVMKDNYQDFTDTSQRESLNFPLNKNNN